MKRIVVVIVGLLMLASVSSAALVDLNAAYVSKYMWRGYELNGTQAALQPGATVYLGETGFSLGVWGSYNLGDLTNRELTEIDYTATYASSFGDDWDYSVYYSTYNYPVTPANNTGELFLSLTGKALPCEPTLCLSYDNDKGKGSYLSLALKNSFEAGPLPLDASLSVGYDGGQYGVNPGISDASVALASEIPAGAVNVTPSVNYVMVNTDNRAGGSNVFWFGVNVAGSI